jgi:succinate dehydrogenase / fumarate reductase cytochrome b subunit
MNKFFEHLNSSVGRKWLMALTGLFLCLFVLVHASGNLQLFKHDGGKAFNQYTVFMTSNPLIKIISYLNYATILLHAINGLYLAYRNRKARPVKYEGKKTAASASWSSRNMGILGTILLLFIIIHMGDFWREYHFEDLPAKVYTTSPSGEEMVADFSGTFDKPQHYYDASGNEIIVVKDLYAEVAEAFESPLYVGFYLISMFALSFHLAHGFQSAFQTFGIRGSQYSGLIRGIGNVIFALVIPALFASMPIYFLLFTK